MYKFLYTSIKKIKFYYLLCPVCHHIFFVGPCWSWLFLIFEKSFIKDVWHNFEYVSDISLASLFLLLNISNIFIQCFYYFIAFFIILLLVRYFFELKKWQSIYSNWASHCMGNNLFYCDPIYEDDWAPSTHNLFKMRNILQNCFLVFVPTSILLTLN